MSVLIKGITGEAMNDLISRLSEIRSNYNCFDEKEEPYYRALSEAIQLVSAQPEEKRGEWVKEPNCTYRCSQCSEHYSSIKGYMSYSFCPNCGADMRGKEDERTN